MGSAERSGPNPPPSVSIIIPTYNSERTLRECLSSISTQDYPRNLVQIVIADGGSTDSTLGIVSQFHDVIIVNNRLRTGESGKAIGILAAKNEIFAFVDSDNILGGPLWLKTMTAPFSDTTVAASEPLYFSYRPTDPLISRYCALIGANDPLTVYLGNHDRFCYFKQQWTETPVKQRDCGSYLSVELNRRLLPTFGANGFLVRSSLARQINQGPFLFDLDLVQNLASGGRLYIAKVKIGIIHLFASSPSLFLRKSFRRIRDYSYYHRMGVRTYPWQYHSRLKLLRFVLFALTIIPTFRDARKGYKVLPDLAWLFHPFACFLVLAVYGTFTLLNARSTFKQFKG